MNENETEKMIEQFWEEICSIFDFDRELLNTKKEQQTRDRNYEKRNFHNVSQNNSPNRNFSFNKKNERYQNSQFQNNSSSNYFTNKNRNENNNSFNFNDNSNHNRYRRTSHENQQNNYNNKNKNNTNNNNTSPSRNNFNDNSNYNTYRRTSHENQQNNSNNTFPTRNNNNEYRRTSNENYFKNNYSPSRNNNNNYRNDNHRYSGSGYKNDIDSFGEEIKNRKKSILDDTEEIKEENEKMREVIIKIFENGEENNIINKNSFPGSLPKILNNSRLNLIDNSFFVSEKSDGTRYFFAFFPHLRSVFLVNRKFKFFALIHFSDKIFKLFSPFLDGITLFDGELVENLERNEEVFLIFDVICFDGENISKKSFSERKKMVEKLLEIYRHCPNEFPIVKNNF